MMFVGLALKVVSLLCILTAALLAVFGSLSVETGISAIIFTIALSSLGDLIFGFLQASQQE
jgi:hypothetical protein